jgi:beta-D-xylosidase 4
LGVNCTRDPPAFQACLDATSQALPFCNFSLGIEQRLDDLLGRLSLEEKIIIISPQSSLGNICECHTGGIDRLGISQWTWLVEANSGVAASCYSPGKCSTSFNGPEGLGASFNRTVWRQKGSVFGNEMRAYNNLGWHRATGGVMGLTGFGPNINIVRDPRFGRNSELPGEDPLLSGTFAAEMVQGMQVRDLTLFHFVRGKKMV